MRRSIKVFSFVAASTLLGACGSSVTQVTSASGGGVTDPAISVPEALVGEDRLLVPLGDDLDGLALKGSALTLGASARRADGGPTVLRLPSGATIGVSRGGQTEPKAPPEPGAAELAGTWDRTVTEASWTTSQGTAVVQSTMPIRAEFLEGYARAVVSLPQSLAESVAAGKPIEPLSQTFRIGGLSFTRTLDQMFAGSPHGLSQTLTVDIDDSKDGIVKNHSDLGGDLGTPYPQEKLVFRANDRYHWLVMAAGGLDVQVSGDDRADRVTDDLTGATYLLVTDENGDDQAELTTATQGEPTVSTFTPSAD